MSESISIVNRLAAGQWGMLTTAQAVSAGVSRKRLSALAASGALERVGQGIYAMPASADDEQIAVRAAWLAMDPTTMAYERVQDPATAGVISHASAAELHRLGNILPLAVEITYPTRHQTRRDGVRIHRAPIASVDVTTVDGLPVTTAARTIADLIGDGHDLEHVAQVAAAALDQDKITTESLAMRLGAYARRLGARSGDEAVDRLLAQVHRDLQSTVDQVAQNPLVQQAAARNIVQGTGGTIVANWQKSLAESAIARIGEQINDGAAARAGEQMRHIAIGKAGKALADQHAQQLKALQMPWFKNLLNSALGDVARSNNAIIAAAFNDTIMPTIDMTVDVGAVTTAHKPSSALLHSNRRIRRASVQKTGDHLSGPAAAEGALPAIEGDRPATGTKGSNEADEVDANATRGRVGRGNSQ